MHGYGYILGHSGHFAFTAQVLLAVFSWLFLSGKMYIFLVQFWVQSRVQSMFCTMPTRQLYDLLTLTA